MRTSLTKYETRWVTLAICANVALTVAAFAVTAQQDIPFAPSQEVAKVKQQLKGVKHRLITSAPPKRVLGIDFCQSRGSANGRPIVLKDLVGLDHLSHLKILRFDQTHVDDEWLRIIAKCEGLEELAIADAVITSKGMSALTKLNLERAGFAGSKRLDDDAMETLADWENLKHLCLFNVPITDNGVHILRGLADLETLDLSWNDEESTSRITNASLKTLAGFTKLRELNLNGTAIDGDGIDELVKALPNCRILY